MSQVKPTYRTIDIATLAAKMNEGLADVPDYQFGPRKFYQRDYD